MSNAKSLVSDIIAGLRLDEHNNYDQWHRKIKYLLSENRSIEFITEEVKPLANKDDASKVKRYRDECKKDRSARFLMLSCMADDLAHPCWGRSPHLHDWAHGCRVHRMHVHPLLGRLH